MKSFPKRNQGFSLIEILLVIGIIAVLAIAAFLVFPQVQASQRANAEQSNIMTVAAGVKQVFNGRYGAAADTDLTANIVNAKIAPANMVNGTAMISSWGKGVTVTGDVTTFDIAYADVPEAVCLKLAPGLAQNFEKVTVGSTTIKDSTAATPVAYDPVTTITACNAAATQAITVTSN